MIYLASKTLGWLVLSRYFRWKRSGERNVPKDGPLLICSNHISWWDPVAIGSACRRRVRFMAKEELFRNKAFGAYLRALGAFPVRRGKPDRKALKTALSILSDGGAVGLFVEGTRSKDGTLGRPEPGAAVIAVKTGAPIVPVGILGRYSSGGGVEIRIGEPFTLPPDADRSGEGIRRASNLIMERIASLRGEEYRVD